MPARSDGTLGSVPVPAAAVEKIRKAGAMEPSRFRVGVLTPMPSELRPVVKAMALTARGDGAYVGTVGVVDVVAMRTGMGLARATAAVTRLLDREAVDHVVVVGIAGGIGATRVGDIVSPAIVIDGLLRLGRDATRTAERAASEATRRIHTMT